MRADKVIVEAYVSMLDEALNMSPQQKMDFSRMMSGALSRKDYNEKWKKPVNPKSKLDPSGIYHNLIKTAK